MSLFKTSKHRSFFLACYLLLMVSTLVNLKAQVIFSPPTYICYQTNTSIIIDGKEEEPVWKQVAWMDDFIDIRGQQFDRPPLSTKAKLLWDSTYLYVYVQAEEPHIWGTFTQQDTTIYQEDAIELFIDPDDDGHNYYELQINALNTIWDLLLLRPYRTDPLPKVVNAWHIEGLKKAVFVNGTINNPNDIDQYWSVELAIPLKILHELNQFSTQSISSQTWRFNIGRVDWPMQITANGYEKHTASKENYWVWSPAYKVNMHLPETWGFIRFAAASPSQATTKFLLNEGDFIKWGLWQLYQQQLKHYKRKGYYTDNWKYFKIPKLSVSCKWEPSVLVTPYSFEFSAKDCRNKLTWVINQNGQMRYF